MISPTSRVLVRVMSAIAVVASLVLSTTTPAAAHGPDPVLGATWFAQDQPLRFDWRTGAVPPAVIRTAITAAAADATSSRASRAATIAWSDSGPNPIGYGPGAPCGVNGLACFTRTAPTGFTMWFREQGHRFDWGTMRWCQAYDTPPNGCYDAETIALDEFGHVEGLDHHLDYSDDRDFEDAVVQTFSRTKPDAGWNAHRLGACDVATLQREYDVQSTSQRLSTCLDLATVLTLDVSATVVGSAMNLDLTASLAIASISGYDRLKGDLLSGRLVTLQRRVTGTTTWTSLGAMTSAGSGTYETSLRPVSTYDYRAVFATPTSEGLTGTWSSAITVRVVKCTSAPCPQLIAGGSR